MTELGLIVYWFEAPLVFANAAFFTSAWLRCIVYAGRD